MSPELESKLYTDFPKLFAQKNLPKEQTCMCWGIETPDEWFDVLYRLCTVIQEYIDTKEDIKQIEFTQVKEKFGYLRVYTNYQDKFVQGAIAMADKMIANEP